MVHYKADGINSNVILNKLVYYKIICKTYNITLGNM